MQRSFSETNFQLDQIKIILIPQQNINQKITKKTDEFMLGIKKSMPFSFWVFFLASIFIREMITAHLISPLHTPLHVLPFD